MFDPQRTAFVFPGQGSQAVGMGADLARRYHVARQTFQEADDVLGYAISRLCFEGPAEQLNDTYYAQPALYVAGIAALRTLYEALESPIEPVLMAGHSLGELTALTAAGAMSFPEGLKLVQRRGELMREAGTYSPGGMAAILGLTLEALQQVCAEAAAETGGVVVVANDNCPGQIVIAGDEYALEAAMQKASGVGAKRVVRLEVSIAAHSPLMARVSEQFREALRATPFHKPILPVIGNVSAAPLRTVDEIRADLGAQLTSMVRWTESVQAMRALGIDTFIELGSKNVLTGLLKRIDRDALGLVVDTPEGIEAALAL